MHPSLIIYSDISGKGQRSRSKVKYVSKIDDISRPCRIFNIHRRELKQNPKCRALSLLSSRSGQICTTTSGFSAMSRYVRSRSERVTENDVFAHDFLYDAAISLFTAELCSQCSLNIKITPFHSISLIFEKKSFRQYHSLSDLSSVCLSVCGQLWQTISHSPYIYFTSFQHGRLVLD